MVIQFQPSFVVLNAKAADGNIHVIDSYDFESFGGLFLLKGQAIIHHDK